jgi:hypothetical protein
MECLWFEPAGELEVVGGFRPCSPVQLRSIQTNLPLISRRQVGLCKSISALAEDNLAAMEADIQQLKAEQSISDVNPKARLQRAINQLGSKVDAQLQKAERG